MSDTAVERSFDKEPSWRMFTQDERFDTPVPLRKSLFISEQNYQPNYIILSGRKATGFARQDSKDVATLETAEPVDGLRQAVPHRVFLRWIEEWDKYDYIVAIGAFLIFIGLLVPILTKDKTLAFVFPIGAACVGAGARLARRDTPLQ